MNEHTVSDACLEFVPLTMQERAEQQAIALWVDGEKVPNLRRMTISDHEIEICLHPSRSVNRLKELGQKLTRVPVEYTCRKLRLRGHGLVLFVGETMAWPSAVAEISIRIGIDEGWSKETL